MTVATRAPATPTDESARERPRRRVPAWLRWCVGVVLFDAIVLWGVARYLDDTALRERCRYLLASEFEVAFDPATAQFEATPLATILALARKGADERRGGRGAELRELVGVERARYVAFLGHVFRGDTELPPWPPPRATMVIGSDDRDFERDLRTQRRELVARGYRSPRAAVVLPTLIAALDDPLPFVRRVAISVLLELDAHALPACEALRRRMRDDDASVRLDAATALIAIEGDDRSALAIELGRLMDPDSPIRRAEAARVLGTIEDRRAVPFLEEAQSDTDDAVRAAATGALRAISSRD